MPASPHLFSFVLVDLEDGADPGPYIDTVLDRTAPDAGVSVSSSALRTVTVDRALDPYVRALTLFAVAVALAGLGIAAPGGVAVGRSAGSRSDDPAGCRRVLVPPAGSQRGPRHRPGTRGRAVRRGGGDRRVRPVPPGGGRADRAGPRSSCRPVVLGVGFLVILALGAIVGALAPTTERVRARRPSRVVRRHAELGLGPAPVAGVRSALAGDGRGAGIVPTIAGVTIALTAVVTALTYQAGLDRLLDEPARFGWRWDEVLDAGDEGLSDELIDAVGTDPQVEGVSVGYRSLIFHDGDAVQLFAFDRRYGDTFPVLLEGREPSGTDEVALGAQTLDRLDASVGDVVEFRGPQGEAVELLVVGQTLLPLLSFGDDLSIGEGGLVSPELVEQFDVNEPGLALVDMADDAPDGVLQEIVGGSDGPRLGTGVGARVRSSPPTCAATTPCGARRCCWRWCSRCSGSACSRTRSPRRPATAASSSRCSDPSGSSVETSVDPSAGACSRRSPSAWWWPRPLASRSGARSGTRSPRASGWTADPSHRLARSRSRSSWPCSPGCSSRSSRRAKPRGLAGGRPARRVGRPRVHESGHQGRKGSVHTGGWSRGAP